MFPWQKKPLLIGLGPIRSGSTWVHELLFTHPQVAVTGKKEVNFFNLHFARGPEWYDRCFRAAQPSTRLYADMSPLCIVTPEALDRIRETVPDPRFLIGLRSPYARVLSWYLKYIYRPGGDHGTAGLQARGEGYGVVAPAIGRYVREFGADRVHYFDYDFLKSSPEEASALLQRALDLDFHVPRSVHHVVNGSNKQYNQLFKHKPVRIVGRAIRSIAPELSYNLIYGPLRSFIFARRGRGDLPYAEIVAAMESFRPAFERDIDEMEEMVQRDFSGWRFEIQIEEFRARALKEPKAGNGSEPRSFVPPGVREAV